MTEECRKEAMAERKTVIGTIINRDAVKAQYDAEVKRTLSDKSILAWIMKYSVIEFRSLSIEEIRSCIEGEPQVATKSVFPCDNEPELIMGINTEDKVPGEGMVTYDIKFFAVTPDRNHVKLIINIEAQKRYRPGYDIVTRAVFYCARMLSSQCDREFTPRNYDDIKKVYSIWICMEVPKKAEYAITRYHMCQEELYGEAGIRSRYDLLEVVTICLGKENDTSKGTEIHKLLSTLLSESLSPKKKTSILNEEFHIATSVELEGGLKHMCNLSDLVEEHGIEKGIKKGIEKGIEKGVIKLVWKKVNKGKSLEAIAEDLECSTDSINYIYKAIKANPEKTEEEIDQLLSTDIRFK